MIVNILKKLKSMYCLKGGGGVKCIFVHCAMLNADVNQVAITNSCEVRNGIGVTNTSVW